MMDRATFEWVHEIASKRDDLARKLGQVTLERDALLESTVEARQLAAEHLDAIGELAEDLMVAERALMAGEQQTDRTVTMLIQQRDMHGGRAARAEQRHRAADQALTRTREQVGLLSNVIAQAHDRLCKADVTPSPGVAEARAILVAHHPGIEQPNTGPWPGHAPGWRPPAPAAAVKEAR
jgi:hypothetical protein